MFLDMARDYLCWDNVESAEVQTARLAVPPNPTDQQLRDGSAPPPFNPARTVPLTPNPTTFAQVAKRRNLTRKELATSGGAYTGKDRMWLIPAAVLPQGFEIKPGDVVIGRQPLNEFDTDRWTVLDDGFGKYNQTWRLTTRNLTLAYELRELITVERPAVSYDGAGAAVKAWPSGPQPRGGVILYGRLAARVQLLTKDVRDERGIRGLEGRYDVIVDRQIVVTNEDRILWRGQYLDILGYRNADRIDELPTIDARLKV